MEQTVTNEILDILEPIKLDNSIESYQHINYLPPSSENLNLTGNPITIEIQAADKYHHISKSYLYIEGQLVRADNDQPFAENTEIALANNAMMYMFQEISLTIGDKTMEQINNPGQVTSMLGYLIYPDDYNTSSGLMSCWSKDTTPHANSRKYTASPAVAANAAINADHFTPTENPEYNSGYAARRAFLMSSQPRGHFAFAIPFSHMFGFVEYDKVIYNVKHCLSLKRFSEDNHAIHSAQGVQAGKIKLSKLIWKVPVVKLEREALTIIREYVLEKKLIPVTYSGRNSQSTYIPQDVTSYEWKLGVKGGIEKPRWIIVGFQTDKNRTQQQNSAIFDHLNVQSAYAYLNSAEKYPATGFISDFELNRHTEHYKGTVDFKENYYNFNSLIGGSQINVSSFKTLYPIYVFDVRRQSEELKSGVIDMHMEFNFNNGVPARTYAYSVIISDRFFKLASDGKNLTMVTY